MGVVRVSKTTLVQEPPLVWLHYRPAKSLPAAVALEMQEAIAPLTRAEQTMLLAEFRGLMRVAERGGTLQPTDVREIIRHPEIWELRWNVDGRLYRLYFSEPVEHPALLVSLRFHQKRTDVDDAEDVNRLQNEHIAVAVKRFDNGANRLWGDM